MPKTKIENPTEMGKSVKHEGGETVVWPGGEIEVELTSAQKTAAQAKGLKIAKGKKSDQ